MLRLVDSKKQQEEIIIMIFIMMWQNTYSNGNNNLISSCEENCDVKNINKKYQMKKDLTNIFAKIQLSNIPGIIQNWIF